MTIFRLVVHGLQVAVHLQRKTKVIHMKMLCFKFHQNRKINEEFNFWGDQFFRGALRGAEGPDFKISLIQNGGLNPHRKFQHSSSIRKRFKNRGTDSAFGAVIGPPKGGGRSDFRNSKKASYRTAVRTYTQKFSTLAGFTQTF